MKAQEKGEHKMVIKTDSGIVIADLLLLTITDIGLIWIFYMLVREHPERVSGSRIILMIFALVMISALYLSDMVFNGRVLIMDSKGCTVSFGPYSKRYNWSDLQTRRMEYFCLHGEKCRGVVFAKKHIRSMNYSHPSREALLLVFSSCFYVVFGADETDCENKIRLMSEINYYYKVDEKEFLDKMHEWGVRIENGLPPEKRKKYPWNWV